MHKNKLTIVLAVILGLSLGPATTLGAGNLEDQLSARGFERGSAVNHIIYGHMQAWEQLDDKHVIIMAGDSGNFLMGFKRPCKELDPALHVSFTVSAGKITTADRVNIEWDDGRRKFCYIARLNRLEKTAN